MVRKVGGRAEGAGLAVAGMFALPVEEVRSNLGDAKSKWRFRGEVIDWT